MREPVIIAVAALFLLVSHVVMLAQVNSPSVVVFTESKFPAADSAAPTPE
jgi:hypothetical protein